MQLIITITNKSDNSSHRFSVSSEITMKSLMEKLSEYRLAVWNETSSQLRIRRLNRHILKEQIGDTLEELGIRTGDDIIIESEKEHQ